MTEEQTTKPDVNETETEKPKEKKPRSMLQEEALHKARQKAYENRTSFSLPMKDPKFFVEFLRKSKAWLDVLLR